MQHYSFTGYLLNKNICVIELVYCVISHEIIVECLEGKKLI